jgi:phosphatidylethanolamine/phosphatidyl-N-methylethanolamine N-methyltransferase
MRAVTLGSRLSGGIKLDDTLRIYRRYAYSYDFVFGALFEPGRRAAAKLVNGRPHQRVLEVGVGTGLSLPHYRHDARVVGVDVSPEMLAKASQRVARLGLRHVETIAQADAERLTFADNSFDAVVALYVASVVGDTARFGAELRRVCKADGHIVVVNHFSTTQGPMRAIEKALASLARHIGFHADFSLNDFLGASGLHVTAVRPVNLFGYWILLECVNDK